MESPAKTKTVPFGELPKSRQYTVIGFFGSIVTAFAYGAYLLTPAKRAEIKLGRKLIQT